MVFLKTKYSLSAIARYINGKTNRRIKEAAVAVGFIKRNDGKLLPETFVKALTIGMLNISKPTLQIIADKCEKIQDGLSMSKEAIYQRLKPGVNLLKEVMKEALNLSINSKLKVWA